MRMQSFPKKSTPGRLLPIVILMLTFGAIASFAIAPPARPVEAQPEAPAPAVTLFAQERVQLGPATTRAASSNEISAVAAGGQHTCTLTATGGVRCWGRNASGQLGDGTAENRLAAVVVRGLDRPATSLVAGSAHTCALMDDGSVRCWGRNVNGQLGDGTTEDRSLPVAVSGLNEPVSRLVAGAEHTCAVLASGNAVCWGANNRGQLGDGSREDRATPVAVAGLPAPVTALAAGSDHTCARTNADAVVCWGRNGSGQLGDGSNTNSLTPVAVSGLAGGVQAISAAYWHTCALLANGSVRCWGYNGDGQLGDGSNFDRSTPVAVAGLSGVTALAAGDGHTCALSGDGTIACWGDNNSGQLGTGTTEDSREPVILDGISGGSMLAAGGSHTCVMVVSAVQCWGNNAGGQLGDGSGENRSNPVLAGVEGRIHLLASGEDHTCAITHAGGVLCWGANDQGQLGDGTLRNRNSPTAVVGLSSGITDLSAGAAHTCALTDVGGVLCWGANTAGQLGTDTNSGSSMPIAVPDLSQGVLALAAGDQHSCALTHAGEVRCWGLNSSGQLGDGTTTSRSNPVDVASLRGPIVSLTAGAEHSCALNSAGEVFCWGANSAGQLGEGTRQNRLNAVTTSPFAGVALEIAAGDAHTCVRTARFVYCWGADTASQAGTGNQNDRLTPTSVDLSLIDRRVRSISAGAQHTCLVTTADTIACWGHNRSGQLGNNTTVNQPVPRILSDLKPNSTAIAAGQHHTCAVTRAGGVRCWGDNSRGQIGDGTLINRRAPAPVDGLTNGIDAVAAGSNHTCAVTDSGQIRCWGDNSRGQLGDNTKTSRNLPVAVSDLEPKMLAVAGGREHTCALSEDGTVFCWGFNSNGQLGDGTTIERIAPVPVNSLSRDMRALAVGDAHSCALNGTGELFCWGRNNHGQLGDATTSDRLTPVAADTPLSISDLAAGEAHTCIRSAEQVYCVGWNAYGQIADLYVNERYSFPEPDSGLLNDIVGLAAGQRHSCALTRFGVVYCWGWNGHGQLGDGTRQNRPSPTSIGVPGRTVALTAGDRHTCAVNEDEQIFCWGDNDQGQLGTGNTNDESAAAPVIDTFDARVINVSAGSEHTCALLATGSVQCWGNNSTGQLGNAVVVSNQSMPGASTLVKPLAVSALPITGQVGADYQHDFGLKGIPAPAVMVAAGSLPSGLSLDPASGILRGTPAAPGSYTFALRVENLAGVTTVPVTMRIVGDVPSPTISTISPGAGPPGTQISISGTDFAAGTTVQLGTTSLVNVEFVNPSELRATVPDTLAAGTYDLTVTNPDGQRATLADAFRVQGDAPVAGDQFVYLPLVVR